MRIKFLGASGQVTGSSFLLTSDSGEQILIDCGMFQGSTEVQALNRSILEFEPQKLLSIILTHAHLDHCGRLPVLTKNGFNKQIWMTPPTRDITDISLFDTAHINEEDEEAEPLYDKNDVIRTVQLFKTAEYRQSFNMGPFKITFRDAGHIIGSAQIEVTDNSSSKTKTIVFSGDLGNSPEDLIMPTEKIEKAQVVVMETTYGDRLHPPENVHDILTYEINEIEKTGGTLLIPSFSIERAQEIVHRLSHLANEGVIDTDTKLFFDSPMGERVTEVFETYTEYFNKELTNDIQTYDPFHFPGMQYVKNSRDSRMISEIKGAKIIIAGSGMMTGGRIIGHAKKFLPLSNTRLLFVGYQAEETLGREILEGAKAVKIDGESVMVNASVNQLHSLSSHADQSSLFGWLKDIKNAKKVFLVHGEDPVRKVFADKLKSEVKQLEVYLPNTNEEFDIS